MSAPTSHEDSLESFFSSSTAEMSEIVLPNDANVLGNILGGKVMHLIDIAAAVAASRHCHRAVVTASVDSLEFHYPVKVGELIIVKASLNRAFRTSMEIGVKVWSEDLYTGEHKHTSSAYLTFVALNEQGKPVAVPEYVPTTEAEKRRWQEAGVRRATRLHVKDKIAKMEQ